MAWLFLVFGIITEASASVCMKLSGGFSNIIPTIFTFFFWGISLSIFIYVLKHFEISFAYGIWAGLGIMIISIIGMVFFKEKFNFLKLVSIIFIALGAIGLNISDFLKN